MLKREVLRATRLTVGFILLLILLSCDTNPTKPVPATGVSLNHTSLTLEVGMSETLIATVEPSKAKNQGILWSSSDENIAAVSENFAVRTGGGIHVNENGIFTMLGGTISGNSAGSQDNAGLGGGAYVEKGYFTMSGGSISGNFGFGGGASIHDSTFFMSDGSISGNAYIGISMWGSSSFIFSGGIIYGNQESGAPIDLANIGERGATLSIWDSLCVAKYGDGTDILPHTDEHISYTNYTIIGR